jgi:P pilus assembly chaperone PapD
MKNNRSTIADSHSQFLKYTGILFLLTILTSFLPNAGLYAQGSLLLTPKRVVFEGTKSSESINLANLGKDTAQYVISLVEYKMKEDGGFEEITQKEAGQFSAVPYIRYFPRTVTLAPNEAQVIRIQLNK